MKNNVISNRIKIEAFNRNKYLEILNLVNQNNLKTVCVEANCPNRYECFANGTATFMILGDVCTRNCRYCNIKQGAPNKVDENEPYRVALAIKKLGLKYVVITCVTRDDLKDCGAAQFVRVVKEIRKLNPECRIELLISDLNGNWDALKKIVDCMPDVINHNIETVKDLFSNLRPKGNYDLSLELLKKVKEFDSEIKTKSGFMLGFGEDEKQILNTISDLKNANCDILTIGQYLQPSSKHFEVKKYYSKEEFDKIKIQAEKIGFKNVVAGSLVRSSYRASQVCQGE